MFLVVVEPSPSIPKLFNPKVWRDPSDFRIREWEAVFAKTEEPTKNENNDMKTRIIQLFQNENKFLITVWRLCISSHCIRGVINTN
tara:strand:+ start:268 stop:525 length:258 start_codon:yes stop_codon:yes gene_type:complete